MKDSSGTAEDFLIDRLSSNKSAVLKNALEALSEIGTQKSLESIRKLAEGADARIQKRAQVALKKIEKQAGKLPDVDTS